MRFIDLLESGESINCDLIIGGCDMPASFVWDNECKITEYGIKKFAILMVSKFTRLKNGNIEIHCDDELLGEKFCLAASGRIYYKEYDRLFDA